MQPLSIGRPNQRILVKTPKSKEFEPSHTFHINETFSSALYRIKVQQASARQGEAEPERNETRKKVDEDRKHEIEACIVRLVIIVIVWLENSRYTFAIDIQKYSLFSDLPLFYYF